ncbi:unnamed protein product, partial [Mesorhabditis spiculigera]
MAIDLEDVRRIEEAVLQVRLNEGVLGDRELDASEPTITRLNEKIGRLRRLLAESAEVKAEVDAAQQRLLEAYGQRQEDLAPPALLAKPDAKQVDDVAPQKPKQHSEAGEEENNDPVGPNFLVTPDELAAVPSYMKGRLTVADLNEILTTIDTICCERETFLHARNLSQADKIRQREMRSAKEPKLDGMRYVTEAELRDKLPPKAKLAMKYGMQSLRHLGRCKETLITRCKYIIILW